MSFINIIRKISVCKAPDCNNNSRLQKHLRFFPFPTDDEERCQVWLALSGHHDLINETKGSRVKQLLLCAEHFELDQFEDLDKTMLVDSAVPTIFSFSVSPGSPGDMDVSSVQGEVSEYDPDVQETDVDSIKINAPSVEVVDITNVKQEDETGKAVATTSSTTRTTTSSLSTTTITATKTLSQIVPKTITATVGGKKRILMAVPKEMYVSAVKSGKIPFVKPINTSQTNKLQVQEAANTNSTNQTSSQVQVNSEPHKSYGASKRKLPQVLRCDEEVSRNEVYIPLGKSSLIRKDSLIRRDTLKEAGNQSINLSVNQAVNQSINLSGNQAVNQSINLSVNQAVNQAVQKRVDVHYLAIPTKPRVFQVAPELPVQAQPVAVSTFNWTTLTPDGWQDWPVPLDVFLASAVQLKNNYLKLFPKKDRMDIETTLHLAANYKKLGIEAKAHVRARVHHFLKILQLEKAKLSESNENNEN